MLKLSSHLGYLFPDLPLEQRFAASATCGFKGLEFPNPYVMGVERFKAAADRHGLKTIHTSAPNDEAGEGRKGLACLPGREKEFAAAVERGIAAARTLRCRLLNVMAGIVPPGADAARIESTYRANMAVAAERCRAAGVTMMIEPISDFSMPGYYMCEVAMAVDMVRELRPFGVKLMYDLYHAEVTGCDPVALLADHYDDIAHVQVADAPGRHEPGTGVIDFKAAFQFLTEAGYEGWIGCEYTPKGDTKAGLAWATAFGLGAAGAPAPLTAAGE